MTTRLRSAALLVATSLALAPLGACKKKEEAATGGTAGSVAPPKIPPPPPPPPRQTVGGLDGGAGSRGVAGEVIADPNKAGDWIARTVTPALEAEAKARPAGALKAEDVLAAVEKHGVKLLGRNQALGSIVGAAYCLSADTDKLIGLLVCEYPDEAAAEKGKTLAKQIFNLAMPMNVLVKGKTTLSITNLTESAETAAEAKKITDAFGTL